uniref:Ig-like domain-containing protein n=1 Tax=Anopheles maculatus TaxID=74869 RepID=A0A182S653_9DIPT
MLYQREVMGAIFNCVAIYSVKTDLLPGGAMSRLYIANANRYDTGNYTCALADIAQAMVSVHVLNGENPAAMQHGAGPQWKPLVSLVVFVQLLVVLGLVSVR